MKSTKKHYGLLILGVLMVIGLFIFSPKSYAEKIMMGEKEDKVTIGIIDNLDDLKGYKFADCTIVGVSPNKSFTAEEKLYKSDLVDFFNQYGETIDRIKSENGIEKSENDALATGDIIVTVGTLGGSTYPLHEEKYQLVLFGDADGDGKICHPGDFNVVVNDLLNRNVAKNVYRVAANVSVDYSIKSAKRTGKLSIADINRMILKYLTNKKGNPKLGNTLVNENSVFKDVDESAPVITPSDDFILTTGDTAELKADKDVVWVSSDENIATVDENGVVTAISEGEVTITAIVRYGKTSSITITVEKAVAELSTDNGESWKRYSTVSDAVVDAYQTPSIVRFVEDMDLNLHSDKYDSALTIASFQDITFDLNGKNINVLDEDAILVNGKLTIQDSGENGSITTEAEKLIEASSESNIIVNSGNVGDEDSISIESRGNVQVNGGNVNGSKAINMLGEDSAIEVNNGTINGSVCAVASETGNITVNNGTLTASNTTITPKSVIVSKGGEIVVNNGNITNCADSDSVIYMNGNSGNITVNNGTIKSGNNSLYAIYQFVNDGNVYVYGGTVEGAASAIRQEKGTAVKVIYKDTQIQVKQFGCTKTDAEILNYHNDLNLEVNDEIKKAAIVKDDSGDVIIGRIDDDTIYDESQLLIAFNNNGIIAEHDNSQISVYNGAIKGTSREEGIRSIGSANEIILTSPISGYRPTGEIKTNTRTNKKYVVEDIIFERN